MTTGAPDDAATVHGVRRGGGRGHQRDADTRAAARATATAFVGAGFAMATWASRIPQYRDRLDLGPSQLGMVLLTAAVGSLVSLPLAGWVVGRFGSRRTVAAMAVLQATGVATVAVGYQTGIAPVVAGLFVFGFGNGAWDVAMNVQGAAVERRLRRSVMPRFHAGFSVGTVAGAVGGAGAVVADLSPAVHLAVVALLVAVVVPWRASRFVPDEESSSRTSEVSTGDRRHALAAWREPRTLMVGFLVLAFSFAEGVGVDWISVGLIDGYGVRAEVGTWGFAIFLTAMTAGRWLGPRVLDRFGRVVVLRVLSGVGVAGCLLFVFAPNTPVAFVGAALWGVGACLGFPVGMSAGADEPRFAAGRVSVIASLGYCAFLAGPAVVGFLGDRVGVLSALASVAVLLTAALLLAPATRPPRDEP